MADEWPEDPEFDPASKWLLLGLVGSVILLLFVGVVLTVVGKA